MVFGAGSFITSVLPNSFASTARIMLTPNAPDTAGATAARPAPSSYDPYRIQTELEVIQSEAVLDGVIEALDLVRKWGRRYGGGRDLERAETLALLRKRLELRPVRNANVIEIRVYDDKADEAAKIANEIAEAYRSRSAGSDPAGSRPDAFRVEIIDQATPALRPVRPNRPLNLVAAALVGILFGIAAAAARLTIFDRKQEG